MTKMAISFMLFLATSTIWAQDFTLTRATHMIADSADLPLFAIPFLPPGESGENKVWEIESMLEASPLPMLSLRRDSLGRHSVIFGREIKYLAEEDGGLKYVECESPLRHTFHDTPGTVFRFPFAYGDSLSCPYRLIGKYCGQYFLYENGDYSMEADATGRLILSEDTLDNVLRIHTHKTSLLAMSHDSTQLGTMAAKRQTTDFYAWYARGYRYPIACSMIHTLNDDAHPVVATSQSYCLPSSMQACLSDSTNEAIRQLDLQQGKASPRDIIHYSIRQSGSTLTVDYTVDQAATITLIVADVMGVVYQRESHIGAVGEPSSVSIDCSGFHHGQYILYLNVNGTIYNEKLVI